MKILIADDHAVVREGLKQILTGVPGVIKIEGVSNGLEVIDKVKINDYDVIVLDISMPGKSGLDVLKEIKVIKPKIPVLMLSIYPEGQYALRVLKAGAAGYLTKESATEELVTAVEKVYNGQKYITPALAEKLADEFSLVTDKLPHESLSDREFEVFKMIAQAKTLKEIAESLYISVKTVSTYKSRIFEKMNMNSNSEITQYAIDNGLIT
ncbi:MAG: response regulator transcription factor [Ignavibacteria bacterium]|jgi:DNA-binding NarL/FixJ family response regulator